MPRALCESLHAPLPPPPNRFPIQSRRRFLPPFLRASRVSITTWIAYTILILYPKSILGAPRSSRMGSNPSTDSGSSALTALTALTTSTFPSDRSGAPQNQSVANPIPQRTSQPGESGSETPNAAEEVSSPFAPPNLRAFNEIQSQQPNSSFLLEPITAERTSQNEPASPFFINLNETLSPIPNPLEAPAALLGPSLAPFDLRSTQLLGELPSQSSTLESIARFQPSKRNRPFQYELSLLSSAVYDSNPNLSSNTKNANLQLRLGPALRIHIGRPESEIQVGAVYEGSKNWFIKEPRTQNLKQAAALEGIWRLPKTTLTLRSGIDSDQSASRDVGNRTTARNVFAKIQANYQATEKVSSEVALDATQSNHDALLGSKEERLRAFLDYALSPKFQTGIGGGVGTLRQNEGKTQKYTQGLLRCLARPTEKLVWNASAGIEGRQFEESKQSKSNPIFSLGGLWIATAKTSFGIEAERRSFASASLKNQNFESSKLKLIAREQMTETIEGRFTLGCEHAIYSGTIPTVISDRTDDYFMGRVDLLWAFHRRGDIGLFFESGANHSTQAESYSFRRNQLGMTLSIHF